MSYIPMSFMLAFFVTVIVNRWTVILNNIGFVDTYALMVASHVRGTDERTRLMRRNLVRYVVLAQVSSYYSY